MTLGDLVDKIQDDLIDVRVTGQQIIDAINESIDYYKRMDFYFTNLTRTFTVTAGQGFYTSNDFANLDDAFSIDWLKFSDGGDFRPLKAVLDSDISEVQTGSVTGSPRVYASVRMGLRLFPIPDTAGTVQYSASEKTLTLKGLANETKWLIEAPELIRAAAKVRIALNKFNDPNMAQGPAALEAKELAILQAETRKRQTQVPLKLDAGLVSRSPSFYGTIGNF